MAKKTTTKLDERTVTADEVKQVDRPNSSGKQPVVFVHGLWLLSSSWDRWAKHFEIAGFCAVRPGWPDDPDTVEEAKAHPEVS
jgi:non-heme chloroperoxidase